MRDHLLAYQEARKIRITFETFTYDFYEDFVNFLSHEYVQRRRKQTIVGLKINTVGKTINQLRTFLINRAKKKIIQPVDLTDYKKQGKSKHWVVIPLRKIACEILEDRFRTNYVPLTNAEFNRHIKIVAKLAGPVLLY
jgi:hypothetical protein